MIFFLKLILVAMLGQTFLLAMKSKSMADTARKANLQYSWTEFIKTDFANIVVTAIVMALFMIIFGPALDPSILIVKDRDVTFFFDLFVIKVSVLYEIFIMLISATVGYSGQDLALRLFSRTNALIKKAIDYKTTIADVQNNTTDQPTPVK